jgi:hypothetical protein
MSIPTAYRLGTLVELEGEFFSDPGLTTHADPTTVVLSILDPAGTTTIPTVTRSSAGVYTYAWTPTLRGMHEIRWQGTGAIVAVDQEHIFVEPALDGGVDMCTVADVQLRFQTTDDPPGIIQAAITAASRTANQRYNREFTPQTTGQTRIFRMDSSVLVFPNDDLRTATAIVLDPNGSPTTLQATDYRLQPAGLSTLGTYTGLMVSQLISIVSGTSLAFGYAEVAITGDWGAFTTATVPEDLRNACVETVGSWLDRAVEQYASSIAGQDDDFQAAPDRFAGYAIPPSAHSVFSSYGRTTLR